eukprot:TRINITY_DN12079_c0_g1::TRINITY_DN12079_c0_g1_i1::g.9672::m.9672 TRINITY_DN12079_c0_g1::TRINITY_DN12079_c0_g1_i1::g.9672  ORF type:complete len:110 (-),score=-8.64,WD40/PF00400.27/0.24,WD40/PF00400.27/0.0036 TRINITY_DN12079_c0_g1_i1:53-382(-)
MPSLMSSDEHNSSWCIPCPVFLFFFHSHRFGCIRIAPWCPTVISVSADILPTVGVYDISSDWKSIFSHDEHSQDIMVHQWHPTEPELCVSVSKDAAVHVWRPKYLVSSI